LHIGVEDFENQSKDIQPSK